MDPRIAAYVQEVSRPGIPCVSYSHETLRQLYIDHGKQVIDDLLDAHWEEQRKQVPPGTSSK